MKSQLSTKTYESFLSIFYFFKQRLCIFSQKLSNENKQRLYKIQKRPTSLFYHVLLIKQNECSAVCWGPKNRTNRGFPLFQHFEFCHNRRNGFRPVAPQANCTYLCSYHLHSSMYYISPAVRFICNFRSSSLLCRPCTYLVHFSQ